MSKELMEIGGFITSGAEIVNHDNSLSGNGTVDSPLGVVPGYNETVLWSGNAAATNFPLTLTESLSNFEKVMFIWIPRYQGDYGSPTVCDIQETSGYGGPLRYTLIAPYWNASTAWLGWWFLGTNDDQTQLNNVKNAFGNPYGGTGLTDGLACRMIKVVGINRKA